MAVITAPAVAVLNDEQKLALATAVSAAALDLDSKSGALAKAILAVAIKAGEQFEGVIAIARNQAREKSVSAGRLLDSYASMARAVMIQVAAKRMPAPSAAMSLRKLYTESVEIARAHQATLTPDAPITPDAKGRTTVAAKGGRPKVVKDAQGGKVTAPAVPVAPMPKTLEEVVHAMDVATRMAIDVLPASDSRSGDLIRALSAFRTAWAAACTKNAIRL